MAYRLDKVYLVGGWTTHLRIMHIYAYAIRIISPIFGVKIKNNLKPPPTFGPENPWKTEKS